MDVCCMQELSWKSSFCEYFNTKVQTSLPDKTGNNEGIGGVGILVKEEIFGNFAKVRRKSNKIIAIVLT